MTDEPDALPIPGLEPPQPRESALKLAARRTIAELQRLAMLDDSHAVICQLILDLCDVVDAGRRQGRASAAAMAAAQLLAAYQLLKPEAKGGGDEDDQAWSELVEAFRRGTAKIRDATDADTPQ